MPLNAHPPTVDATAFDLKVGAAERSALVDFALWGGLVPGTSTTRGAGRARRRGLQGVHVRQRDRGLRGRRRRDARRGHGRAAALGLPVAVHAERPSALGPPGRTWRGLGRRAAPGGRARGDRDRARARRRDRLRAARRARLNRPRRRAGGRGTGARRRRHLRDLPALPELCENDLETLGVRAKCAPPLRSAAEREALWRRIGDVAFVASDHSPAPAGDEDRRLRRGVGRHRRLPVAAAAAARLEAGAGHRRRADVRASRAAAAARQGAAGAGRRRRPRIGRPARARGACAARSPRAEPVRRAAACRASSARIVRGRTVFRDGSSPTRRTGGC